MKKARFMAADEEVRAEYDFSKGVRGKYAREYSKGSNIILLDPDIAALFPNSKSVNEALRSLARIAQRRLPKPSRRVPPRVRKAG